MLKGRRRKKLCIMPTLLLSVTLLFSIQLLSSVFGFEKCKREAILCYIVIATVLFLLLGFISFVFFPILNSLLDTLIEDQTIFLSSLKAKNCAELYNSDQRISGVYTIYPDDKLPFDVYCDQTTAGGGWTVIQKRLKVSDDFNRTWDDYKHGFGNFLVGEYWLGLEKIRRLTENKTENRLRVVLGVKATKRLVPKKTFYAEYASLKIGDEEAKYKLNLGNIISKPKTINVNRS